ncbi:amine sulfotransferase-like [Arapaima gigas]
MAQQEYKLLSDRLFTYKGMVLPIVETHDVSKEYIDSLEHFEIRDSDVFLVTFPKSLALCGPNPLLPIITTLLRDDDIPVEVDLEINKRMPWLELLEKGKDYNCRPLPGFFCSHLQEYLVPRGLCNNKAKVRWYKNCNKYKFLFLSYEQMIKERWQHGVVDRSLATDARGIRHHWGLEELLSSVPE